MSADPIIIPLADAEATTALGAALAAWLLPRAGGVIFLRGDLGAGKTTLARGLLRALGVRGAVKSPTYTLVEPYDIGGRSLLHMDLYRLQDADELEGLGLRDHPPEENFWLVEWPEHGGGQLPRPALALDLQHVGEARCAALTVLPDDETQGLPLLAALRAGGIAIKS